MLASSLDWTTISSLATAFGTLVLAVATFVSVRSSNQSARTAERALDVGLRPVLFPSRLELRVDQLEQARCQFRSLETGDNLQELCGLQVPSQIQFLGTEDLGRD